MGNILYIIAVILIIGWLLGVFVYSATGLIHALLVIALIALAYLEEDGLLLAIALLAAVIVLAVASTAVWQAVLGALWIGGFL